MNTATNTGMDDVKTTSKRAVQKTTEASGDLLGNKIADKITSVVKSKQKNKENRRNFHSTRKKNKKSLMILNCFEHKI